MPDDNIFVSQPTPPPTQEEKKRTTLWVIIALIIGFAIVVAIAFFTLFLWANGAADRYRGETELHINALVDEVEAVDIASILNQRDTTELLANVENSQTTRPQLEAVILAESTSALYQSTRDMQTRVDDYYQKVVDFVASLPHLLAFSQAIDRADNDLLVLLESRPPTDPIAARTVAGSIDDIAATLSEAETPEALMALRDELAAAYRQLGEGYRDLASAYEGPEISQSQAERRIDAARRTITDLNETDLTQEVTEYRAGLITEAETLINQL